MKYFYVLCLLIIFVFSLSNNILSYDNVSEENFDSLGNWEINTTDCNNYYLGDGLNLVANDCENFPFAFSKTDIVPQTGNYKIVISFLFPEISHWGVGIGLGDDIPPYPTTVDDYLSNDVSYMHFQVWQESISTLEVKTIYCSSNYFDCGSRVPLFSQQSQPNILHTLSIEFINNRFYVYFDNVEARLNTNSLLNTNKRARKIWIGNPFTEWQKSNWTDIKVKSIKIYSDNSTTRLPVVIVPGMGASWNEKEMLGLPGGEWKIPDFVEVYEPLINLFLANGYEKNKDLFVYPYDWRDSISENGVGLSNFIASKKLSDVNIVAHSMGGLVARSFMQDFGGATKVNKLITLGSPHKGATDAYGIWEGGEVWQPVWWAKAGVAISGILEQKNRIGRSYLDGVRAAMPSVRDILPTYNFLLKNTNPELPSSDENRNVLMTRLNENISSIDNKVTAIVGTGSQTKEQVKVTDRSLIDALLGLWIDGKPIENEPYINTDGDWTVIKNSARGNFSKVIEIPMDHMGLAYSDASVNKVGEELGLGVTINVNKNIDDDKNPLVLLLRSPGGLYLDNSEIVLDGGARKAVVIPDGANTYQTLRIQSSIGETGNYDLYIGNISEKADWQIISGYLDYGDTDTYVLDGSKVTTSISDAVADLAVSCNLLTTISSRWDQPKKCSIATNINLKANQKITAVRNIRNSLVDEIKRGNRDDSILRVWEDADNVEFGLLSAGNYSDMTMMIPSLLASIADKRRLVMSMSGLNSYQNNLLEKSQNMIARSELLYYDSDLKAGMLESALDMLRAVLAMKK